VNRSLVHAAAVLLAAGSALAPRPAAAINLVPNPSFETISSCPVAFGQLSLAAPWDVPNTGTSDCYNVCVTGFPPFPLPDVPLSPFGYQAARTGAGFAGIYVWSLTPDYREYLQVPLASPLAAGGSYLVKFYVALGDTCSTATDRLGAHFSVGPVGPIPNNTTLPLTPQVESPAAVFLADTMSWTLVSGTFTAAGGETHLVIGNFHDDANTATVATGNTWPGAYYFVDDVSVELQLPTLQACCTPDGLCSMQFPGECQLLGGSPAGAGTTCDQQPYSPTPVQRGTWGALKTRYR
jgi:hypothetical protein